ncbi:MAG: tRNA 2-thiocytidine(32) synthetase TtcA [Lachnospiraceae bacterium]|nr:tRNA 2-thiocytidine(32) synthetase TtcA [Lachnospiraceae bacterium]
MKMQRLYSYVRRAVDDYHMIEPGDVIAVGVSGGKDSLALLYTLHGLQRFYPAHFDLQAIFVDLGYESSAEGIKPVQKLCSELSVPFTVVHTSIRQMVFEGHPESASPCSLCARLRKGALNEEALKLGCNKIAYGHHRDDMVETMMMSLIYEGRFYAFPPVTQLVRTGLTVIRPRMYVSAAALIGLRTRYELPVYKNPCPADGSTRRAYVKKLLAQINRENHGATERMFHALTEGHIEDWPEKISDKH